MTNKTLGARVRYLREVRSKTQRDLAKFLKIPRTAVSLLENGKRQITGLELDKTARFLSVGISEFFNEKFWEHLKV